MFASLVVFVGRVNGGSAVAEAGARYAARTMSLARDPRAAADEARADAETTVSVGSPSCRTMSFAYALEADQVTVSVTCTVELVGLGVPATWTVTGRAQEPIDRWREAAGS